MGEDFFSSIEAFLLILDQVLLFKTKYSLKTFECTSYMKKISQFEFCIDLGQIKVH